MIEIIVVFFLSQRNSKIAKSKGYEGWPYFVMTIVLWVGFEILGAFVGRAIAGSVAIIYVFALVGAAIGGVLSYLIVKIRRERVQVSDWVSVIGAMILLISVFLEWYKVSMYSVGWSISGWDATKLCIIIILCSLAAIAIVVFGDLDAMPVPMSYVMIGLGGLSALIVIIRILIRPVGVGLSYGIFISLVASAAVIVGGVLMQIQQGGLRAAGESRLQDRITPLMQTVPQQGEKFCTNCGNKIEAPADKCASCGADLAPVEE